jgi:hypothetical protein
MNNRRSLMQTCVFGVLSAELMTKYSPLKPPSFRSNKRSFQFRQRRINQSINQSIKQASNQAVNQAINQSTCLTALKARLSELHSVHLKILQTGNLVDQIHNVKLIESKTAIQLPTCKKLGKKFQKRSIQSRSRRIDQ